MLQLKLSSICCLHLLCNTKHTLIVLRAFAVSCAEKGILSLWSQLFAEFLAVTWMLDHEAGVKKSLPVFGGDFNHHMIMHQASNHVLHFMKHDPDDAGKQCAIACMRHLLRQDNVLPLETGKILYFYHVIQACACTLWGLPTAAFHSDRCCSSYSRLCQDVNLQTG